MVYPIYVSIKTNIFKDIIYKYKSNYEHSLKMWEIGNKKFQEDYPPIIKYEGFFIKKKKEEIIKPTSDTLLAWGYIDKKYFDHISSKGRWCNMYFLLKYLNTIEAIELEEINITYGIYEQLMDYRQSTRI